MSSSFSGRWCEWAATLAEFDQATTDGRILRKTMDHYGNAHHDIPVLAGPHRNLVGSVTVVSYGAPAPEFHDWTLDAEGHVAWDMLEVADPVLAQKMWDGERLDVSFSILGQKTVPDERLNFLISAGPWRVSEVTLGLKSAWPIASARATTMHWDGVYS